MPVEQRVLRKTNDDMRYVCDAGRRSPQIELAVLNALLQKISQYRLSVKCALFLEIVAKLEICLEDLRAACCTVYDVRACAVLRHDHRFNSVCGRPFLRSGCLSKTPRVFVESLQPGNKQVFLPLPIQINGGAR